MVARHKMGKMEWNIYKSNVGSARLFPERINDWSIAQRLYIQWCGFYDGIYESMDRPPERVIDNEKLLEIWFKDQEGKAERYSEEAWSKVGKLHETKSAYDYDEVIMMDGN